jgi:hypothetical protein
LESINATSGYLKLQKVKKQKKIVQPPIADGFDIDPLREALGQELISKFKSFMTLSIPDPLSWNCPESSAEDWDNVPEMAVQIILYLEKHGKALTEYVKLTAKNESTFELRKDLEERLKVSCELKLLFIPGNEYEPAGLD